MEFCYEELLLLSYLFIYCTHFLLFIYFILIGYVDAPVLTKLIKSIDLTLHFYLYLYEDAYYFMHCNIIKQLMVTFTNQLPPLQNNCK